MFSRLVETLLGCWHGNYSFPMTLKTGRRYSNCPRGTYVVCLDCGRELPYDWGKMRVVGRSAQMRTREDGGAAKGRYTPYVPTIAHVGIMGKLPN
jgi:hypothetical protein